MRREKRVLNIAATICTERVSACDWIPNVSCNNSRWFETTEVKEEEEQMQQCNAGPPVLSEKIELDRVKLDPPTVAPAKQFEASA